VRGAAAWALGRIADESARTSLCDRLAIETDPNVREELQQALAVNENPEQQ
jgi:HEAT repeat protein